MNLNTLIQKIINISIKIDNKEKEGFTKKNKITLTWIILFPTLILSIFTDLPIEMTLFLGFYFFIFITIPFFALTSYLMSKNNLVAKFIIDIYAKEFKLTKEEENTIKEYTLSSDFIFNHNDNKLLLDYLINKNINTLDYKNLEEFFLILQNNNLLQSYINKIYDKITNQPNLMKIVSYQIDDIVLSKEEYLILKLLKENREIRRLTIQKLYKNCSLKDVLENKYFLNDLIPEEIFNKLIQKYTLKEITHSLFSNSFNNQFFKIEISNMINLLNTENKFLFTKYIIEIVLNNTDNFDIIQCCHIDFLKFAEDLNIENKHELYLLKSKFPEKQLITNDNFKIIHI